MAPPRRFRHHRGHQGNRRQQLSSAVAGGTTGGREGRPSPISQRKQGMNLLPHRHTGEYGRGSPTSSTPPAPREMLPIGTPRAGPAPQGKTQLPLPLPSAKKPHSLPLAWIPLILVKINQPYILWPLHPHPTSQTEAGTCHCQRPKNPFTSAREFSRHLPHPHPR